MREKKVLVKTSERKRLLGTRRRWRDNIKVALAETRWAM
jgi:hypothetical protein